ncbi:extracellular solute-binding protein [Streptomyces uncialis]|uniref:extracellular solute-binding protein n=1 Tax=Streptomyces uncialis TaxID=1048205 RepID=UPI00365C5684
MRRTLTAAVATLLTATLAAGCGSPSGGSGSDDPQTLVVYSNSVSDGRGDWLKKEAGKAGHSLQVVDLGGGDVQNRLLAEKANPVADVTFGLNNVYFEKLKEAEVLGEYTPAWADQVDAALGDATGKRFWPIVREPIMLVHDKAAYPEKGQAPADWPDLWTKEEFRKKYEVPTELGGATTQMVLSGILSRHRDDQGDLGVGQAGWDAVESYFEHGVPSVTNTDLYARMADGKVTAGQMWLSGKATREEQYKIRTEAVRPETGVPMVVQQIGLVNGTKKAGAAKRFIDWFGGAEVQAAWSREFHTAPANEGALPKADAAAVEETDSFTEQDIDWTFVAARLDRWTEKIELEYLPN